MVLTLRQYLVQVHNTQKKFIIKPRLFSIANLQQRAPLSRQ